MKKYRSKFEKTLATMYPNASYEEEKLSYIIPETKHTYTPDFIITTKSGKKIYIESKGRFSTKDRKKMVLVKEQYPELDIRIVFQNANITITPQSKTTVSEWCIKHGFIYGNLKTIAIWIKE